MKNRIYNFPGGYGLEETPDPIPNSAVKLKDANGTAGVTPWESRLPPGLEGSEAKSFRPFSILGRLRLVMSLHRSLVLTGGPLGWPNRLIPHAIRHGALRGFAEALASSCASAYRPSVAKKSVAARCC